MTSMKILPDGMQVHLDSGATTLCWCWMLTRRDGVVQGFTDQDAPLIFVLLGVLSTHTSGFLRIQTGAGLSGVRMEINPSSYAAAGEGSLSGSCALKLNAGDTVKVVINVGGAGKMVDVYGAALGSVMYTNFQGFLIAG